MENRYRSDIVSVVTSPLGFFALSILIVEGFLAIVLIFSDVTSESKFWGMIIGAALFFLVVLGVWYLVLKKPKNLTFGEQSHLEHERMFGADDNMITLEELENEKVVKDN